MVSWHNAAAVVSSYIHCTRARSRKKERYHDGARRMDSQNRYGYGMGTRLEQA